VIAPKRTQKLFFQSKNEARLAIASLDGLKTTDHCQPVVFTCHGGKMAHRTYIALEKYFSALISIIKSHALKSVSNTNLFSSVNFI
jgi:hypothetical protein